MSEPYQLDEVLKWAESHSDPSAKTLADHVRTLRQELAEAQGREREMRQLLQATE